MTKSFCLYNEVDIPAELKSLVEEVEEKLASKEEKEEKEKVTTEEAESVSVRVLLENDNPEVDDTAFDTTTSVVSEDVAGNEEPLEEENPSSDSEPLDEQPA